MATVDDLCRLLGDAGAFKLIHDRGGDSGGRIYIPQPEHIPGHAIEDDIGRDAATKLAAEYACQVIKIPALKSWKETMIKRRIMERYRSGDSIKSIAEKYSRTPKFVRKVVLG